MVFHVYNFEVIRFAEKKLLFISLVNSTWYILTFHFTWKVPILYLISFFFLCQIHMINQKNAFQLIWFAKYFLLISIYRIVLNVSNEFNTEIWRNKWDLICKIIEGNLQIRENCFRFNNSIAITQFDSSKKYVSCG